MLAQKPDQCDILFKALKFTGKHWLLLQFVIIVSISIRFVQIVNSSAFSIFGLELDHATRPKALSKQESFEGQYCHMAERSPTPKVLASLRLTSKPDRAGNSFLSVRKVFFFHPMEVMVEGSSPDGPAEWLTNEVSKECGHRLVPIQHINTGIYCISWIWGVSACVCTVLSLCRSTAVSAQHRFDGWLFSDHDTEASVLSVSLVKGANRQGYENKDNKMGALTPA